MTTTHNNLTHNYRADNPIILSETGHPFNRPNLNHGEDAPTKVVNTNLPSNSFLPLSAQYAAGDEYYLDWTKQFGTSDYDYSSGVSVDSSGNIYVSGTTRGSLSGNTSAGMSDAFIAKYNSAGNQLWVK